jgi:hypothetical protein
VQPPQRQQQQQQQQQQQLQLQSPMLQQQQLQLQPSSSLTATATPSPAQILGALERPAERISASPPTRTTIPLSVKDSGQKTFSLFSDDAAPPGRVAPDEGKEFIRFKQANEATSGAELEAAFRAAGANDDTIQQFYTDAAQLSDDEDRQHEFLLTKLYDSRMVSPFPTAPVTGLQYQQPEVFRGPDEIVRMIGNAQTQVQPATPASGGIGGALSNVFSGWAGAGPR